MPETGSGDPVLEIYRKQGVENGSLQAKLNALKAELGSYSSDDQRKIIEEIVKVQLLINKLASSNVP